MSKNGIMDMEDISTDTLLQQVKEFSKKITALRDKPFCTIRQLEDLQTQLEFNRIMFKMICDELSTRELSAEKMSEFQKSLGEQT